MTLSAKTQRFVSKVWPIALIAMVVFTPWLFKKAKDENDWPKNEGTAPTPHPDSP